MSTTGSQSAKLFVLFLILCSFLVTSGCSRKDVEVQVFIVTSGGQNIRLGLVDIHVIPSEDFVEIATTVSNQLMWNVSRHQGANDLLRETREILRKENYPVLNTYTRPELDDLLAEALQSVGSLQEQLDSRHLEPSVSEVIPVLGRELSAHPPVGRTDADGVLRTKLRKGDVLFAWATRQVGSDTERYYWIFPVNDTKSRILLSNDNLAVPEEVLAIRRKKNAENPLEQVILQHEAPEAGLVFRLFEASKARIIPYAADPEIVSFVKRLRSAIEKEWPEFGIKAEQFRIKAKQLEAKSRAWLTANIGKNLPVAVGDGVVMEFVWIAELNAWVGKYEVTNGEFRQFLPGHESGSNFNGDRQPVVQVSYDDAVDFCEWLTERERAAGRLPADYRYRLPTGGEWTTIARCGTDREYPWGNSMPPTRGNYSNRISGYSSGAGQTVNVEQSGRNEWGLYGVGGNVWEWTSEQDGSSRVLRGASWNRDEPHYLRVGSSLTGPPSHRSDFLGFRIVLSGGG